MQHSFSNGADFSGMRLFQVTRFDAASWQPVIECRTFDSIQADKCLNELQESDALAKLDSFFVATDLLGVF